MKGDLKLWLGVAVSLLLVILFFVTSGFTEMIDSLTEANYIYLIPALLLYQVSVYFRTLRWQVLLKHLRRISVFRLFPIVTIGYMANNLLPMRLGEVVRSYYVGEREDISKVSALMTIVLERLFDALILMFFIAVVAIFVPLSGVAEAFGEQSGIAWPLLAVALSLPFVGIFAVLLSMAFWPDMATKLVYRLSRLLPGRISERVYGIFDTVLQGIASLRSPKTLGLLFLLSAPIWLFESSLFFMIGFSFGFQNSFDSLGQMAVAMVLVTAITNIVASIPAAPGGLGVFEIVARETLVFLPLAVIDRPAAAGFVTVVHAALLLPMIILGQVFLWFEQVSLGRLYRAGRSLSRSAKVEPSKAEPYTEGEIKAK